MRNLCLVLFILLLRSSSCLRSSGARQWRGGDQEQQSGLHKRSIGSNQLAWSSSKPSKPSTTPPTLHSSVKVYDEVTDNGEGEEEEEEEEGEASAYVIPSLGTTFASNTPTPSTPTPHRSRSSKSSVTMEPFQLWQKQQELVMEQLRQEQQRQRRPRMVCTSEKEVCLPANYSRFQLPNRGKQTIVSIGTPLPETFQGDHSWLSSCCLANFTGFDGFDVRKIDDIEYTVEISCYFLTKWADDRLILSDFIRGQREDQDLEEQWFPIDLEFVNKVWFRLTG